MQLQAVAGKRAEGIADIVLVLCCRRGIESRRMILRRCGGLKRMAAKKFSPIISVSPKREIRRVWQIFLALSGETGQDRRGSFL
jgi:hypothetical protein